MGSAKHDSTVDGHDANHPGETMSAPSTDRAKTGTTTPAGRLTAVGRYIELYQEHCATMPLLNNQECAVIERLAEWAKERCPFPIGDDDGSISDCIAKGHCGCNESGRNDRELRK